MAAPGASMDARLSRSRLRGLIAAIAAISIFAFGMSLSLPLFAVLLEEMGVSATMIGFNGAASALSILIGGVAVPVILRALSLPVVMAVSAAAMAAMLPVFPLVPDPWVWMGLRFLFGFSAAALFVCSEIWIVSGAPPGRRGLFIGIYGLFLSLGFLAGPSLLKLIGTAGWPPFLAGAFISLCAIPPILLAWRDGPELREEAAASFADAFRFFRTDPAILWAVLLFGMVEFGAMGLFPVWSIRAGGDPQQALTLVALLAAGNVLLQIPLGWIGDRLDRRRLLALCAAVCVASALIFPGLSGTVWPIRITTVIWGGLVVGLYTFSLNELGSRYAGAALARGTGALAVAYGFGALAAPPLLGAAMDVWPPHGMFWVLSAAAAAYLALLAARPRSGRGLDSGGGARIQSL